jgi:hypothetical protein
VAGRLSPPGNRRASACTFVGLQLLAGCGVLHAEEFFPTHVENMLTRGFYVPLPSDARLSDGLNVSAAFSISNTVNYERRGQEQLLVDGESDTLRVSIDQAFASRWRYRLSISAVHDGGGFLDSAIEAWHRFFGFQQGYRPFFPKNQLHYQYQGFGAVNVNRSGTALGGFATEAGWFGADTPEQTFSLWGGLQMPTGSAAGLTGDGALDGALWGHWARRGALWQVAAEAGIAHPFGDEIFSGHAHHAVAFARTAVTREFGPRWSLRAQLDGQTRRVDDSELRFLGPSLQLSVGALYRLKNHWHVDLGFTEDAAVNTAPDITFFVSVHD